MTKDPTENSALLPAADDTGHFHDDEHPERAATSGPESRFSKRMGCLSQIAEGVNCCGVCKNTSSPNQLMGPHECHFSHCMYPM